MATQEATTTVRVGVYDTVEQADRAIVDLQAAGFKHDQISIVCSNDVKEKLFANFKNPPHPKENLPGAIAGGASIGALVLGGLATVAGLVTTGGLAVTVIGPILLAMGGGGVAGGLIGGMMTRGVTREMADYYDQAITQGKILVAIEDDHPQHLAKAEEIFRRAGAVPVPLQKT